MLNKVQIGELLIDAGFISRQELDEALAQQRSSPQKKQIGNILIERGSITSKQLHDVLEFQLGIPFIDLNRVTIPNDMANVISGTLAKRIKAVPIRVSENRVTIAMSDPFDLHAIEDIEIVTKKSVAPLLADEGAVIKAIDDLYGNIRAERALEDFRKENELLSAVNEIKETDNEIVDSAPIVRLVNSILEQAVNERASDIHVEPMENEVRIRLRIDGTLMPVLSTPLKAHSAMITRIKIMGNLNIAEKRIPQDGRSELQIMGKNIDIRISTLPTMYGEKAVLRLLDRSSFLLPKESLGFTAENLRKFDQLLKNPYGIILVTGPTGSGKSTTLYTMLSELNTTEKNIITVEDPVEYTLQGLNQVQVNPKARLTFAGGLRAILRQDPDIIMLGEIRDQETVEIAIRAAVTGHLVLSTLHTNNAPDTVSRLLDMEVEPYMLSAALTGVIAQRLVRKICPICKEVAEPHPSELEALKITQDDTLRFYEGKGCVNCSETGYKGRIAVHEIIVVDNEVRSFIPREDSASRIRKYMLDNKINSIRDECVRLAKAGIISLKEAISVAYSQD